MEVDNDYNDEITLKDLILKIQEYRLVVWNKVYWIILATIIFGILAGAKAYFKPPIYPAKLTFMVNEDSSGGGMGGAASLLGQFGFGGGGGGEYNLDKIVALAKSRKITKAALLDSSYAPLLADQLIEVYNLKEVWTDSVLQAGVSFKEYKNDRTRNIILQRLIELVQGNESAQGLAKFGYTDDTGILFIVIDGRTEQVSIDLAKAIYNQLSSFYINEATEKPKKNYKLLTERADSVSQELSIVERRIAKHYDSSQRILLRKDQVSSNETQRKAQILTIMYAEIIKNKETAHFILKAKTPFFQVIDCPSLPILQEDNHIGRQTIIGLVLGGILSVLFLIFRYTIKQATKS